MILEVRTYRLRPGARSEFVRLMREEAVPLLRDHDITVVTCGASLVDEDGWEEAYLIRAFDSLEAHQRQEEAFYASQEWRDGPRAAILERIESYHSVVLEASAEAVAALSGSSVSTEGIPSGAAARSRP